MFTSYANINGRGEGGGRKEGGRSMRGRPWGRSHCPTPFCYDEQSGVWEVGDRWEGWSGTCDTSLMSAHMPTPTCPTTQQHAPPHYLPHTTTADLPPPPVPRTLPFHTLLYPALLPLHTPKHSYRLHGHCTAFLPLPPLPHHTPSTTHTHGCLLPCLHKDPPSAL